MADQVNREDFTPADPQPGGLPDYLGNQGDSMALPSVAGDDEVSVRLGQSIWNGQPDSEDAVPDTVESFGPSFSTTLAGPDLQTHQSILKLLDHMANLTEMSRQTLKGIGELFELELAGDAENPPEMGNRASSPSSPSAIEQLPAAHSLLAPLIEAQATAEDLNFTDIFAQSVTPPGESSVIAAEFGPVVLPPEKVEPAKVHEHDAEQTDPADTDEPVDAEQADVDQSDADSLLTHAGTDAPDADVPVTDSASVVLSTSSIVEPVDHTVSATTSIVEPVDHTVPTTTSIVEPVDHIVPTTISVVEPVDSAETVVTTTAPVETSSTTEPPVIAGHEDSPLSELLAHFDATYGVSDGLSVLSDVLGSPAARSMTRAFLDRQRVSSSDRSPIADVASQSHPINDGPSSLVEDLTENLDSVRGRTESPVPLQTPNDYSTSVVNRLQSYYSLTANSRPSTFYGNEPTYNELIGTSASTPEIPSRLTAPGPSDRRRTPTIPANQPPIVSDGGSGATGSTDDAVSDTSTATRSINRNITNESETTVDLGAITSRVAARSFLSIARAGSVTGEDRGRTGTTDDTSTPTTEVTTPLNFTVDETNTRRVVNTTGGSTVPSAVEAPQISLPVIPRTTRQQSPDSPTNNDVVSSFLETVSNIVPTTDLTIRPAAHRPVTRAVPTEDTPVIPRSETVSLGGASLISAIEPNIGRPLGDSAPVIVPMASRPERTRLVSDIVAPTANLSFTVPLDTGSTPSQIRTETGDTTSIVSAPVPKTDSSIRPNYTDLLRNIANQIEQLSIPHNGGVAGGPGSTTGDTTVASRVDTLVRNLGLAAEHPSVRTPGSEGPGVDTTPVTISALTVPSDSQVPFTKSRIGINIGGTPDLTTARLNSDRTTTTGITQSRAINETEITISGSTTDATGIFEPMRVLGSVPKSLASSHGESDSTRIPGVSATPLRSDVIQISGKITSTVELPHNVTETPRDPAAAFVSPVTSRAETEYTRLPGTTPATPVTPIVESTRTAGNVPASPLAPLADSTRLPETITTPLLAPLSESTLPRTTATVPVGPVTSTNESAPIRTTGTASLVTPLSESIRLPETVITPLVSPLSESTLPRTTSTVPVVPVTSTNESTSIRTTGVASPVTPLSESTRLPETVTTPLVAPLESRTTATAPVVPVTPTSESTPTRTPVDIPTSLVPPLSDTDPIRVSGPVPASLLTPLNGTGTRSASTIPTAARSMEAIPEPGLKSLRTIVDLPATTATTIDNPTQPATITTKTDRVVTSIPDLPHNEAVPPIRTLVDLNSTTVTAIDNPALPITTTKIGRVGSSELPHSESLPTVHTNGGVDQSLARSLRDGTLGTAPTLTGANGTVQDVGPATLSGSLPMRPVDLTRIIPGTLTDIARTRVAPADSGIPTPIIRLDNVMPANSRINNNVELPGLQPIEGRGSINVPIDKTVKIQSVDEGLRNPPISTPGITPGLPVNSIPSTLASPEIRNPGSSALLESFPLTPESSPRSRIIVPNNVAGVDSSLPVDLNLPGPTTDHIAPRLLDKPFKVGTTMTGEGHDVVTDHNSSSSARIERPSTVAVPNTTTVPLSSDTTRILSEPLNTALRAGTEVLSRLQPQHDSRSLADIEGPRLPADPSSVRHVDANPVERLIHNTDFSRILGQTSLSDSEKRNENLPAVRDRWPTNQTDPNSLINRLPDIASATARSLSLGEVPTPTLRTTNLSGEDLSLNRFNKTNSIEPFADSRRLHTVEGAALGTTDALIRSLTPESDTKILGAVPNMVPDKFGPDAVRDLTALGGRNHPPGSSADLLRPSTPAQPHRLDITAEINPTQGASTLRADARIGPNSSAGNELGVNASRILNDQGLRTAGAGQPLAEVNSNPNSTATNSITSDVARVPKSTGTGEPGDTAGTITNSTTGTTAAATTHPVVTRVASDIASSATDAHRNPLGVGGTTPGIEPLSAGTSDSRTASTRTGSGPLSVTPDVPALDTTTGATTPEGRLATAPAVNRFGGEGTVLAAHFGRPTTNPVDHTITSPVHEGTTSGTSDGRMTSVTSGVRAEGTPLAASDVRSSTVPINHTVSDSNPVTMAGDRTSGTGSGSTRTATTGSAIPLSTTELPDTRTTAETVSRDSLIAAGTEPLGPSTRPVTGQPVLGSSQVAARLPDNPTIGVANQTAADTLATRSALARRRDEDQAETINPYHYVSATDNDSNPVDTDNRDSAATHHVSTTSPSTSTRPTHQTTNDSPRPLDTTPAITPYAQPDGPSVGDRYMAPAPYVPPVTHDTAHVVQTARGQSGYTQDSSSASDLRVVLPTRMATSSGKVARVAAMLEEAVKSVTATEGSTLVKAAATTASIRQLLNVSSTASITGDVSLIGRGSQRIAIPDVSSVSAATIQAVNLQTIRLADGVTGNRATTFGGVQIGDNGGTASGLATAGGRRAVDIPGPRPAEVNLTGTIQFDASVRGTDRGVSGLTGMSGIAGADRGLASFVGQHVDAELINATIGRGLRGPLDPTSIATLISLTDAGRRSIDLRGDFSVDGRIGGRIGLDNTSTATGQIGPNGRLVTQSGNTISDPNGKGLVTVAGSIPLPTTPVGTTRADGTTIRGGRADGIQLAGDGTRSPAGTIGKPIDGSRILVNPADGRHGDANRYLPGLEIALIMSLAGIAKLRGRGERADGRSWSISRRGKDYVIFVDGRKSPFRIERSLGNSTILTGGKLNLRIGEAGLANQQSRLSTLTMDRVAKLNSLTRDPRGIDRLTGGLQKAGRAFQVGLKSASLGASDMYNASKSQYPGGVELAMLMSLTGFGKTSALDSLPMQAGQKRDLDSLTQAARQRWLQAGTVPIMSGQYGFDPEAASRRSQFSDDDAAFRERLDAHERLLGKEEKVAGSSRPQDLTPEEIYSDFQFGSFDEQSTISNAVQVRPKIMIGPGQSLEQIAERLFEDPDVAWLIADLNKHVMSETMVNGKRVVEFRSRQEIELPVYEDIELFYRFRKRFHTADNLVTVVSERHIDREVVDNALRKVVS